MKYFRDTQGEVFGYDETDETQLPLIQAASGKGWTDITGSWPPAPTLDDQVAANTAAIQKEMDRQARLKGYDNILSACSYAAQAVGAPFQAEGAAFLAWRSLVWSEAYTKLDAVKAGTEVMPTPAQAVADMPAIVLPA